MGEVRDVRAAAYTPGLMRSDCTARTVERMFRSITRVQLSVDIVLAALFLLLFSWEFWAAGPIGGAVTALMAGALAVRRLSPGLALAIAWVGAIILMSFGLNPLPSNIAILGVLYVTAAYGTSLVRWLGFASVFAGAITASIYVVLVPAGLDVRIGGSFSEVTQIVLGVGLVIAVGLFSFGLSWTAGLLVRSRVAAAEARAAQQAAEFERLRMQQVVAVETERTRIARELHDIVGHSLAVVIAQADGARYVNHGGNPAVDDALGAISGTARAALSDVRGLLGGLRASAVEAPQPDLAQLAALIEQFRASGLSIELHRSGNPDTLGAAGQLAVFRIVQESLTNVLRHGDAGVAVAVSVVSEPDRTWLRVVSRVRSDSAAGPRGFGITGMIERAMLAGGHLDAGRVRDEFVVEGTLPTGRPAGTGAPTADLSAAPR